MDKRDLLGQLRIDRDAPPERGVRPLKWLIGLGVLGGLAFVGWFVTPPAEEHGALPVPTAVAAPSTAAPPGGSVLDATGYVVARRQATVSAKVTGKVEQVLFEEGMAVSEGMVEWGVTPEAFHIRPELSIVEGRNFTPGRGEVIAALNTMYTAVANRTVEIATLRAIGFGGLPVVASVLAEALLLALAGGLLGAGLAYLVFNGMTVSTLNQASFSQVAFDFAVTPELMRLGLIWALALGAVGGLFPAVRAARLPITAALRRG